MEILKTHMIDAVVIEIGKFTILWSNFEKVNCDYDCNSNKIWNFANEKTIGLDSIRNLSNVLKGRVDFCENCVYGYVNYNLVPDGARIPVEEDLKAIQEFIDFKGENLLVGALLVIYRIRNNLLQD